MKKPVLKIILLGLLLSGLSGCASSYYLRQPGVTDWTVAQVLHRSLDRWVAWQSLYAEFKLTVSVGDTTASARGHIIYLMGERIEFGFRKPWNKFVGNFYVLPDRSMYWGTTVSPIVYGLDAPVTLEGLLPFPLADWDPRDVLPFPVSGRTAGLQPDSAWYEQGNWNVRAASAGVHHWLVLDTKNGDIDAEVVRRDGRDAVYKTYAGIKHVDGWSLPRTVTCGDSSGRFRLTWSLKSVRLKAQPFAVADTIDTFATPTTTP